MDDSIKAPFNVNLDALHNTSDFIEDTSQSFDTLGVEKETSQNPIHLSPKITGDDLNQAIIVEEPRPAEPESRMSEEEKRVQFSAKKPSVIPSVVKMPLIGENSAMFDLYANHTQELYLSDQSVILNGTVHDDHDTNNDEDQVNELLAGHIEDINLGLSELPKDSVPPEVLTWIPGIKQMARFPTMDALRHELVLALKMQVHNKQFDLPFTLPFALEDIKQRALVAGRQQVASTPKKRGEHLKFQLEEEKRRQIREQSIYIEPHKLYRKMPKPRQGFVVYGACFGQSKN